MSSNFSKFVPVDVSKSESKIMGIYESMFLMSLTLPLLRGVQVVPNVELFNNLHLCRRLICGIFFSKYIK